jgi:SAM-dependent methyltransferase
MLTNASPPPSSRSECNRREYRRHDTVELIRARSGWIDIGERILVNRIADEIRSQPILDVGVGGGRTAWMLRTISRDYVAVDYSPEMVEACRHEYPGLDVRECDARDLSIFPDGAFALVVFSFNGIDVLDHVGRLQALAEMHRVLRPGGLMLYSTLNKKGSLYGSRPWARRQVSATRILFHLPSSLSRYRREHRNWRRQKPFEEDHASWAICAAGAYEFRILAHFTLPSTEQQALGSIGFAVEETLGCDGDPIESDSTTTPYFYLLARKTAPMAAR